MTASIKVYADDAANTLLFDSSGATIPTLFRIHQFTYSNIAAVGSGSNVSGKIYIAGLRKDVHILLPTYSDHPTVSNYIKNYTATSSFGQVEDGVVNIPSGMYSYLINGLKPTYPNAKYFFRILEVH
ncbi:hypothetical protein [Acinetobacter sp. 869535]|uniref:hypothetical protein n=1 Tax=Acinetobacter sp. 869535 TaxID=1310621 RepID=UPI000556F244|nr:hypothetical protein [Acinetobacter sp. 869535]